VSNKKKLPKAKEQNYTLEDLVTDAVDAFGKQIEKVMAEAKAEGETRGVMIVANEDVYLCDLVPYGRVWRAGSYDAVNKLRAAQGKQDS